MDDSCAVCAESLEWVAYGACGHKDVCSTCVARLRFICDDRRCCICKTESGVVFVTKALGDYTNKISDFSLLSSEAKEGSVGQYWYHEDTQAFFDDFDHYNMIKAMCRLSCNVCDKIDGQLEDGSRRRAKFRNIEQLKAHLFHKHKLFMCSLCLEGRKVFICEQNLYTRSQLTQHTNTGDSVVDGTESERGGFAGHPKCEFCHTPFYGDNELYTHMSTEHYTCHICQRQRTGQYEYYKNYDDLEMHFRGDHFLCEDDGCLGRKFVVFPTEAELKRHNTLEHGGHMSRSKRSAALQIPTSFRYRRSSEQENRRGRGRIFWRDARDDDFSMAIQASIETASAGPSSSRVRIEHGEMDHDVESLVPPFESLSVNSDTEVVSSRYRQAVSHSSMTGTLGESSFPPLPVVASGSSQQNSKSDNLSKKTMAAHLRRQGNRKVNVSFSSSSSSSPAWPAASRAAAPVQRSITPPSHGWPAISGVSVGSASSSTSRQTTQRTEVGPPLASSSNYAAASQPRLPSVTADSSISSSKRMSHSSSAPNLSQRGSSGSDFPPISAAQPPRKSPATEDVTVKDKDVHTANKSLVEQMRAALGFDEEKFSAFKEISGEYRQGSMDAGTYMDCVDQFGLSHLVLELARLLPDARKQRELIEAHNFKMVNNIPREDGWSNGIRVKDSNGGSKKGKGKAVDSGSSAANNNNNLADDIISEVKELQSSYRASEELEVEVLSKDGYRAGRGKTKVVADESQAELGGASTKLKSKIDSSSAGDGAANLNLGDGNGKSKQRNKRTSKFHRVRLGDASVEELLDLKNTDPGLNSDGAATDSTESLPVGGVWRNGGGQKLLSKAPKY